MKEDKARFSLIHGLDEHGKKKLQLKTILTGAALEKFLVVKDGLGVHSNDSVVRFLISKEYSRIEQAQKHKVFISQDAYRQLEARAGELDLTVDQYCVRLTEQLVKTPVKEVLKTLA